MKTRPRRGVCNHLGRDEPYPYLSPTICHCVCNHLGRDEPCPYLSPTICHCVCNHLGRDEPCPYRVVRCPYMPHPCLLILFVNTFDAGIDLTGNLISDRV